MKGVIINQYECHKTGISNLNDLKTVHTGNFQPIHQNLEFNVHLRESIRLVSKKLQSWLSG
jgi:hypothetical protein